MGERGQVTIPKSLRQSLGLRPGEELLFEERDGALIVRRNPASDPLHRLYGLVGRKIEVDAFLTELRGPPYDPAIDGDLD
ncbi:MAG: AbrB/MazE/SpoVT family DNA-binding domain-containing protein [Gemmatimonadota bacterium]